MVTPSNTHSPSQVASQVAPQGASQGASPSPSPSARTTGLARLLDDTVAAFPDRPAVDFLGKRLTYAELGDLVDRAARGFQQLGVRKGVRVGLCLPNTPVFVICYYAVLKVGGTVVNYNPLYAPRELQTQVEDSGTTLMVTLDLRQIYPKVAALLDKTCLERVVVCSMSALLPGMKGLLFSVLKRSEMASIPDDLHHIPFARLIANDGAVRPVDIDPEEDLAALQYTGGTTGVPKGAMLSHANLSANTDQLFRWIPNPSLGQERMLAVLPLFHVFGMTVAMNLGVRLGAELILLPRFHLKQVIRTIGRKRATLFPGVPTIYTAINKALAGGGADLSSLQVCISGGAPLPGEVRARFESLTGCRLVEGYGLSETAPVATCNPLDAAPRAGSIGIPMPATTIEIRDPEPPHRLRGVNEKGEVCVRGPQVMSGYWCRPEETRAVFVEGALRTGDIGYQDADGYYYLVDRIKDVILCGGYNIYPRVIEEALYQHPDVSEVVVIGVPDDYRGQAPKAFVTLRDGARVDPADLRAFLTEHISRIEMPTAIEIRDALPKTMVGKLSKKELVDEEAVRRATAASAS
ncbi:long-chain-fatty-acid--CoA ligase [Roseospira visakhapatnamensis]|uniref:Long-chain acyl-CoA synthetase n=1 Tax=Roseospira visakhapatnamensis TaxID=390880 RepID=A0A7W6RC17_9PROT|nr:long-chain fatty acid--CoA ligase [Roseospira visakhapatnamensis]MBB4265672.1 long-chain acyl-CoA synthetase [Roseospira visakhapatnamensis]